MGGSNYGNWAQPPFLGLPTFPLYPPFFLSGNNVAMQAACKGFDDFANIDTPFLPHTPLPSYTLLVPPPRDPLANVSLWLVGSQIKSR